MLFRNGRSRGVRLDHVFLKGVDSGKLILPSKREWNTLILSLGHFSEDFLAVRDQPAQQRRSAMFQ
jgi:virulence-associated protein VagC